MKIDCLVLGDFQTNCYVIRSANDDKQCLIIDPGFSPQPLIEMLQRQSLQPQRILLTHGHCDHIAGIPLLRQTFGPIPVSISSTDASMLTSGRKNLAWLTGALLRLDPPDELLEPGDTIQFNQIELSVLATPGHTAGGIAFYCASKSTVFTGDTLFAGSIGRHDFPGGHLQTMLKSIREQLFTLPDETIVYSGHGPETTIATEKQSNPFLQQIP